MTPSRRYRLSLLLIDISSRSLIGSLIDISYPRISSVSFIGTRHPPGRRARANTLSSISLVGISYRYLPAVSLIAFNAISPRYLSSVSLVDISYRYLSSDPLMVSLIVISHWYPWPMILTGICHRYLPYLSRMPLSGTSHRYLHGCLCPVAVGLLGSSACGLVAFGAVGLWKSWARGLLGIGALGLLGSWVSGLLGPWPFW